MKNKLIIPALLMTTLMVSCGSEPKTDEKPNDNSSETSYKLDITKANLNKTVSQSFKSNQKIEEVTEYTFELKINTSKNLEINKFIFNKGTDNEFSFEDPERFNVGSETNKFFKFNLKKSFEVHAGHEIYSNVESSLLNKYDQTEVDTFYNYFEELTKTDTAVFLLDKIEFSSNFTSKIAAPNKLFNFENEQNSNDLGGNEGLPDKPTLEKYYPIVIAQNEGVSVNPDKIKGKQNEKVIITIIENNDCYKFEKIFHNNKEIEYSYLGKDINGRRKYEATIYVNSKNNITTSVRYTNPHGHLNDYDLLLIPNDTFNYDKLIPYAYFYSEDESGRITDVYETAPGMRMRPCIDQDSTFGINIDLHRFNKMKLYFQNESNYTVVKTNPIDITSTQYEKGIEVNKVAGQETYNLSWTTDIIVETPDSKK